jgi:hypothetical protein
MSETIKSLCHTCKKQCPAYLKTEFASRRNLTYIYLNNGNKIINICNQFSDGHFQENNNKLSMPAQETVSAVQPPKLNFGGKLSLSNFMSLATKI